MDYGWELLPDVEVMVQKIMESAEYSHENCADSIRARYGKLQHFLELFSAALAEAEKVGWEGDFTEAPRVLMFPGDTDFLFGFVWKQDNNGSTFVISEVELPHLVSMV